MDEKNGRPIYNQWEEWKYYTEDGKAKKAKYRIYQVNDNINIHERIFGTEQFV